VAIGGPADLDTGFGVNNDGIAEKGVPGTRAFAADAVIQPSDGKIVVAGDVDGDFAVVRFNANGTVDNGFGVATADFGVDANNFARRVTASAVALDSSERIIVAGTRDDHTPDEGDDFALARFTTTGALDMSFSGDGKQTTDIVPTADSSTDEIGDVLVLPSGAILVGGASRTPTERRIAFARYLGTDGSLDPGFSSDGQMTSASVGDSEPNLVSRMVVGATTITAAMGRSRDSIGGGSTDDLVARRFLLADGTTDTTFGGGDGHVEVDVGNGDDGAESVVVQGDGKIVIVGGTSVDVSGGSDSEFAVARLNTDGSLDTDADITPGTSFSDDGWLTTNFGHTGFRGSVANDVALQGTKIVAGGFSDVCGFGQGFAVARYNGDGTPDTGFSGDGRAIAGPEDGSAQAVLLPAADKIILAGSAFAFPDDTFAAARYGTTLPPDSGAAYCPTMLTVSRAGTGSGTVTGAGINCPGDCSEQSDPGATSNDLMAVPAAGSVFAGWEGNPDCDPPADPECFISVGADTTVTARFNLAATTTTTAITTTTTTTTTASDIDPPETTITKGPKKKTTKSKAKLTFTSDEPGSTFECLLKGKKVKKKLKKFKPCSAKAKYKKLALGNKQFQVRATDPAGNVDPTPAKKKWKVKPKT
jgi:uncharacterized delta-60 repeat protein